MSPRFYRPPFGFMTPGQARFIRHLGLEPVLGDVYPDDPYRPGVDRKQYVVGQHHVLLKCLQLWAIGIVCINGIAVGVGLFVLAVRSSGGQPMANFA